MTDAPSAAPSTSTSTSTDSDPVTATDGVPVPGDTARTGSGSPADDPAAVVAAYHHAWTSGQVDLALDHLSEDATCHGPDVQVTTKEDWRAYLTAFVPMLTGAPEHARMTSGDQVALWYYPQTTVTSTTLASELFTVRDGRIVDIHLAFDRLSYMPPGQQPS